MTEAHSLEDTAEIEVRSPLGEELDPRSNVQARFDSLAEQRSQDAALRWVQSPVVSEWRAGRRRDLLHHGVSYAELRRRVAAVADGLLELGIGRGDRVMLNVWSSVELVVSLMALQRLGALPVLIDSWSRPRLVEQCARRVRPKAFIGPAASYALLGSVPSLHDIPVRVTVGSDTLSFFSGELAALAQRSHGCPVAPVSPDDGALLTFSTAGGVLSEGALHSHRSLLAQAALLSELRPPGRAELDLSVGITTVLANLLQGVGVVVPVVVPGEPDEYDGQALVEQMRATEATRCLLTPQLLRALVASASRRVELVPSLRQIGLNGPPLGHDDVVALELVLPRASLHILYGSTHAEPIAHVRADRVPVSSQRGASVGAIVPGLHTKLLRHSRSRTSNRVSWSTDESPKGFPGELVVHGEHVCRPFADVASATVIDENGEWWHRTGDMAVFSDGSLVVLGRVDSTIVRGGELVFSFHAQSLMNRLPQVTASALLGMPDEALGERVVAVVKAIDQVERVEEDVRRVLERAGIPVDEVHRVDAIPVDVRRHSMVEVERLRSMLRRSAS